MTRPSPTYRANQLSAQISALNVWAPWPPTEDSGCWGPPLCGRPHATAKMASAITEQAKRIVLIMRQPDICSKSSLELGSRKRVNRNPVISAIPIQICSPRARTSSPSSWKCLYYLLFGVRRSPVPRRSLHITRIEFDMALSDMFLVGAPDLSFLYPFFPATIAPPPMITRAMLKATCVSSMGSGRMFASRRKRSTRFSAMTPRRVVLISG